MKQHPNTAKDPLYFALSKTSKTLIKRGSVRYCLQVGDVRNQGALQLSSLLDVSLKQGPDSGL